MLIPYGIQSYKRSDLPQIRLVNLYAEKTPANPNQLVLLPRPALQPYQVLGSGPIRSVFQQPGAVGGALFTLSGQQLYSGSTLLGAIPGSGLTSIAATNNQILIAIGTALYLCDGATITKVVFPDNAGVNCVGFIGGYAIASRTGTRQLYFTLDPTVWDGLDYLSAEQSTGAIVGFTIVNDQVWIFCEDRTEIFVTTGNADAPLQRVEGRVFDKGALVRDAIVDLDNTVFWVGQDAIVYRGENTPVRVSDHGIEERIAESTTSDISAWSFAWNGHLFYVLHLTDFTAAFDVATGQWFELQSYGRDRWRALTGRQFGRVILAGDDTTGQVWALQDGVYSDNGDPISREFSSIVNNNIFVDNVVADCSTGTPPTPDADPGIMELRTSRDSGETWRDWRQCGLGTEGRSRTRAVFRRLGMVDQGNMLLHWRLTSAVPSRVSYIRMNDALGGRSR